MDDTALGFTYVQSNLTRLRRRYSGWQQLLDQLAVTLLNLEDAHRLCGNSAAGGIAHGSRDPFEPSDSGQSLANIARIGTFGLGNGLHKQTGGIVAQGSKRVREAS